MVSLRKLSASEVVSAFPKRGQIDLTEYLDALNTLNVGDSAEVELNGISRRAIKRRIGMAARQLGATIKWSRLLDDQTMIFQVRDVAGSKPRRTRKPRSSEPRSNGTELVTAAR